MSKYTRGYASAFSVFSDRPLNKRQLFFSKIGVSAFVLSFGAQVALQIFTEPNSMNTESPILYIKVLSLLAAWGHVIGFFMIPLVAIDYIGQQFGKQTFMSALIFVLGKIFKYILLPALIITALFIPIVLSSYGK